MLNVVQIQTVAIILILSYFIGNFQSAVLFSKRFLHDDVRQHGSGNPGATNMTRVFGTKWGVITFLGDAFKCFLGVALGALLGKWWGIAVQNSALDFALGGYIGGLGVVLGHCWPVLYRFKGGKGVACFFAFMFFTFPLAGAITFAFALGVFFLCHKISLVSMTSSLLFTILCAVNYAQRPWLWLFAALCTAVIIIRHRANIKRLIAGTEPDFKPAKREKRKKTGTNP